MAPQLRFLQFTVDAQGRITAAGTYLLVLLPVVQQVAI
jgi:hypothetical protein